VFSHYQSVFKDCASPVYHRVEKVIWGDAYFYIAFMSKSPSAFPAVVFFSYGLPLFLIVAFPANARDCSLFSVPNPTS